MEALSAAPAVSKPESFRGLDQDEFDNSRPAPMSERVDIDPDNADWAAFVGYQHVRSTCEGAEFIRLADDVFIIPLRGAQPLHHDRHLADLPEGTGFSEHTWNLVIEGCPEQMLLVEIQQDVFEHFTLETGQLIYFNTMNRHMVSRKDAIDVSILVQVDGFGPHQHDEALARINEVLASRPRAQRVGFESAEA